MATQIELEGAWGRAQRAPSTSAAGGSLRSTPATPSGPRWGRWLFWLALAFFVFTRLIILLVLRPAYSDMPLYHRYAVQGIDHGKTPFKDFQIEYPPVAWWAMAAPRWMQPERLSLRPSKEAAELSFQHYSTLFRWEQFLLDVIAIGLFAEILRQRRPAWRGGFTYTLVLATALLAHLLYDRFDTALLCLLLSWAYTWIRSVGHTYKPDAQASASPDTPGTGLRAGLVTGRGLMGWKLASYAILGLSISFKVIPIIVVPFLLLAELRTPRRWANSLGSALALAAGTLLPFLIHYPTAGWSTLGFLQFHSSRGIQVESFYASLLMPLQACGLPLRVEHGHGGFNLVCESLPATSTIGTVTLFAFLAICGIMALALGRRYDRPLAYRMSCLVIAGAVIFSKVLSPQYFIWAFGLLLLLGAEVLPLGRCRPTLLAAAVLLTALLTTWLFPYHYFSHLGPENARVAAHPQGLIPALHPLACGVLLARNLLYLGILGWLGVWLWRRTALDERREFCHTPALR